MYPIELENKHTTESITSASFLNLLPLIERDGQIRISLYGKRANFNFNITNFPFLRSNIQSSPAYGVLSQRSYNALVLAALMKGFVLRRCAFAISFQAWYGKECLIFSFRKFYGRYGDLILTEQYEPPLSNHTLHSGAWPYGPPRWRRGSGLDFGSGDPGSIPRLPSPRVGPLMARR